MENTEKKFDKFFVANLKRTAQMVSPAVKEKQKLQKSIAEEQARIVELDAQISALDGHIKEVTGGYGVEDLIIRNVINTGKTDKDGKPIKVTKWELRYPETVIPPTEEEQPIEETNQEPVKPTE
jgi:hypothetical protein